MATILVVDDEGDVLDAFARALRLAGHHVTKAQDPTAALAAAASQAFDAVILDYIMPAMTGIELLNHIRDLQPTIRSIIVSGKIDSNLPEDAVLAEMRDSIEADIYLHKPLDNARLKQALEQLLGDDSVPSWKEIAERNVTAKKKDGVVKATEKRLNQHKKKK